MRAFLSFFLLLSLSANAQPFTQADTIFGSNGLNRNLWDVLHYDLTVEPDFETKSIRGKNIIRFYDHGTKLMQIDLQEPMILDSVLHSGNHLKFSRNGNAYTIMFIDTNSLYHYRVHPGIRELEFYFHGQPTIAKKAPWDGGWIWTKDRSNNHWVSVACQGIGASVWFPCKDLLSDKADSGAILRIITPENLFGVGNGKLISETKLNNGRKQFNWQAKSPISTYNIIPYIGNYQYFKETFKGLNGDLPLNYYVLPENIDAAKKQFAQVKTTLKAFEKWMGPYPFYIDEYKLVESPHLGMEHQSNIAYGNGYTNGYLGKDLSSTGVGLKWDFIIVHETAHEWFGNSITATDVAEMWIHEGFGTYAEILFIEEILDKKQAFEYMRGRMKTIENDDAMLGPLGVRYNTTGDVYTKGAALVHMMRMILNNDALFQSTLKKMFAEFGKQNVATQQILEFWNRETKYKFDNIFHQYLNTIQKPMLEWELKDNIFRYRWTHAAEGFNLPIDVTINNKAVRICPTTQWQKKEKVKSVKNFSEEYYVDIRQL